MKSLVNSIDQLLPPKLHALREHPNYFHLLETVTALNPDVALKITQLSSDLGIDPTALDAPALSDRFLHFCDWTIIEPIHLSSGRIGQKFRCDTIYLTFLDIEDTSKTWLDLHHDIPPVRGDQ